MQKVLVAEIGSQTTTVNAFGLQEIIYLNRVWLKVDLKTPQPI